MSRLLHILFLSRSSRQIIDEKIKEIDREYFVEIPEDIDKNLYFELLKKELATQLDRKKGIEDKAKSILFAITLTVTILIFSLNSLALSFVNDLDWIALIILVCSIFFLIRSACLSLKALEINEYHFLFYTVTDDNAKQIKLIKEDLETSLADVIKIKAMNDLKISSISNYVSLAYKSIRNGIVGFSVVLLLLMIHSFSKPIPETNPTTINGEINTCINDTTSVKSDIKLRFEE